MFFLISGIQLLELWYTLQLMKNPLSYTSTNQLYTSSNIPRGQSTSDLLVSNDLVDYTSSEVTEILGSLLPRGFRFLAGCSLAKCMKYLAYIRCGRGTRYWRGLLQVWMDTFRDRMRIRIYLDVIGFDYRLEGSSYKNMVDEIFSVSCNWKTRSKEETSYRRNTNIP